MRDPPPVNPSRKPIAPNRQDDSDIKKWKALFDDWTLESVSFHSFWLNEILVRLRAVEANERIQKNEPVPIQNEKKPREYK
jgi:hypothetical protein